MKKETNHKNPEGIIIEEVLSLENKKKLLDEGLRELVRAKIQEANYLKEGWQERYAVERILEAIRKHQCKGIKQKRGLAITSLIFGIIGGYFSTASIPAIIFGHIALNNIKINPNTHTGKKLAIAGLILGYLGLAIAVILGTMNGIINNILEGSVY